MNILVADDHSIVRAGINKLISLNFDDVTLDHASNGEELLSLFSSHNYDIIIMDISMPGVNHINFVKSLLQLKSDARIIVFSRWDEEIFGKYFLKAGAMSYVCKKLDIKELLNAIKEVLKDRRYVTSGIRYSIQDDYLNSQSSHDINSLSKRELEILNLMFEGNSNKQIGAILNIAPTSVSTYRKRIFEKMGTENIFQIKDLYYLVGDTSK